MILAVDTPVHVLPQIARFCDRYSGISVKIETGNTDASRVRRRVVATFLERVRESLNRKPGLL